MRWFQVIYFRERDIQACLDAIIFFANPKEKDAAHITLRGPYSKQESIHDIPEDIIGSEISVIGVSKFFNDSQNTVFLQCGSDFISKYWWKPNFGFHPHITLYDASSREFAERLYKILLKYRLFFSVTVQDVYIIPSIRGQRDFRLWFGIDLDQIAQITGEKIDVMQASKFPDWKRCEIIEELCSHLKKITEEKDILKAQQDDSRMYRG